MFVILMCTYIFNLYIIEVYILFIISNFKNRLNGIDLFFCVYMTLPICDFLSILNL